MADDLYNIFFHKNNVKSITNTLIQNPKMYDSVPYQYSTAMLPTLCAWANSSVNTFIKWKVFILNINQYQEKTQ